MKTKFDFETSRDFAFENDWIDVDKEECKSFCKGFFTGAVVLIIVFAVLIGTGMINCLK